MRSNLTNEELKIYLNRKFLERDFLDNLYRELSEILTTPDAIKKLSSDQICDIIIEYQLLDKLLEDEKGPTRDAFELRKGDGNPIEEEKYDELYQQLGGKKEIFLNILIEEFKDLEQFIEEKHSKDMELRICVSFDGERKLSDLCNLSKNIRFLQVIFHL